ncbi:MAG: deoxyribodipyrimidine photo-lyase [Bacteroidetes bacterium]|nr:deoxyribodipyrimidine photo-lyase [Bacteroidota bacterium]
MINIFWFRRDLRLDDNHGLYRALSSGLPVQLLFIFDKAILQKLESKQDARVTFIHDQLARLNQELKPFDTSILVEYGRPVEVFDKILDQKQVHTVFTNEDYEPYAIERDMAIAMLLNSRGVAFQRFKDQVIFAPGEVLKDDGRPYTVFTPFSKKWKMLLRPEHYAEFPSRELLTKCFKNNQSLPGLQDFDFQRSAIKIPEARLEADLIQNYAQTRNFPGIAGTSMAGVHLRFGTISVRKAVRLTVGHSETWLNELIWREFFMHILYHFPHSATENFNPRYNRLQWRNDEEAFRRWCEGRTGFAMVDAGMRELNATGYMHNRVRMVTASFLTKHLLTDWRWGEAYFASKLLDFELASNVGNWQWAAGTGCDAAPYFRVFNPAEQVKKFDPDLKYIRKWVPEYSEITYRPMLDHAQARLRAIETYKSALS